MMTPTLPPESLLAQDRAPISVLVVEDDPEHELLIRKSLARAGAAFSVVQVAHDGAEALRFAQQLGFDVLLVDNHIPGVRGLDLVLEVRELGIAAPFVLMTAAGSEDLVVEAWRRQVAEYVIKDVGFWRDVPKILTRVVEAERRRRNEAVLAAGLERMTERWEALRDTEGRRRDALRTKLEALRVAIAQHAEAATVNDLLSECGDILDS